MFKKIIGLVFLFCFVFSSTVEARHHSSSRRASTATKKTRKAAPRNRQKRTAVSRKKSQRVSRTSTRSQRVVRNRGRGQQTTNRTRRFPGRVVHQAPTQSPPCNIQFAAPPIPVNHPIAVSPPAPIHLPVPIPVNRPIAVIPSALLSSKTYSEKIAKMMGLDKLPINPNGPKITIAAIEESGTWKALRDAIHNPQSILSPETREHYQRNFLTPVGDPRENRLHPDEQNDEIRSIDQGKYHGAAVAAVILDHKAKVLPVSTYNTPGSQKYEDKFDVSAALNSLVESDVKIINISAGHIHYTVVTAVRDENERPLKYVSKTIYTPKLVEAIKALAQAGKVIVFGAGNNGKDIEAPQFADAPRESRPQIMGHLIEALDRKTRKSIIIAGGYDPDTGDAINYSNRPGNWPEAQERFLFAPCRHMPAYLDYKIRERTYGSTVGGTSYAAPAICAAIAQLCEAVPGLPPKKAMKALLETADQRPEKQIYGRGLIRADKALEKIKEWYQ